MYMRNLKESETLELKRSTAKLKEAIISISAMLNKHGEGEVIFGVDDDGTVVGQQIGTRTLREISQAISEHIQPRIYPRIEEVVLDGRKCVRITFRGDDIPYYAYARVYMRVSDEDRVLSPREIENIILKKNRDRTYWDSQPSKISIEDIDENALREFVDAANRSGRIDFEYTDTESTMKKLGLLDEGRLLRAAEVLFSDKNRIEIQTAIFAGRDKNTFLDINTLKGNLFYLLKETELYVKNHIRWSVRFGDLEREEIPEIPANALREALVNSLCHRDYSNPKGNEVAIFEDRIEIFNPGSFPEGYEPDDFIKGEERSVLRNPLIANTMYLRKDIERWGSGIKRIYDACRKAGVDVDFRNLKSGFLVVFHRGTRFDEKLGEKLGENERKILMLLSENPEMPITQLAEKIGISTTAVEKNIDKLKKKGLLRRIGSPRGGYWKVRTE